MPALRAKPSPGDDVQPGEALAFVNWGRWIASCPTPGCHDARALDPDQQSIVCDNGHPAAVRWPRNAAAITAALERRMDESRRNWYPAGHQLAEAGGYPTDQTPSDLEQEREEHERADAERASKRSVVTTLLTELGLDVAADGTVRGRL